MQEQDNNGNSRELVFSKAVKAGKRTYFFDVKATRANEYYLTITESKKKFNMGEDKPFFEKHKIFLYKEDFEKFMDGLLEAVDHIKENQPEVTGHYNSSDNGHKPDSNPFTNVSFDEGDK